MNNDRRKIIKKVIAGLTALDPAYPLAANDVLEAATNTLEEVMSDEQEAFDNLSEGLQSSRQESHDEIIEALEYALAHIQDVDIDEEEDLDFVNDCIDKLHEIN